LPYSVLKELKPPVRGIPAEGSKERPCTGRRFFPESDAFRRHSFFLAGFSALYPFTGRGADLRRDRRDRNRDLSLFCAYILADVLK
jgi:hypothetical protein